MKTSAHNIRILSLLLLFILLHSISEAKQYFFQQIPSQNGLSSMVRCMEVSQEKGYVWIGTRSGIGRFDGYEQRRYLRGNVTHILEDEEHTIWVITEKGVFRYNEIEDNFILVRDKDNNPVIASSLCLWEDGVIFGGRGRLYKYNYEDHIINLFHTLKPNGKYHISNLYQWDSHTLLATNRWAKALFIDIATGNTRPVPFNSEQIISLLIDRKGNVWVAHYNQGVSCYGRNGKQLQTYHTQNSPLKTNVVLSLEEHNGQIWMGTDGGGIHILNPQTGKISTLRYIPGDRYSLPANSILCLYNDKSNNMWAGSVRNGLINIKEVGMKTYQDVLPGQNYGLSEKTILSIYQDNDNQIWIGTDGGGINLFDPATGKFHHILSTWEEKVASITGMDKNHLLVSLFSQGLFVFHKETHRYQPLVIINDSINDILCHRGKTVNVYQNTPETILMLSETPYKYHIGKKQFIPITKGKGITDIVGTLLPINSTGEDCYLHDLEHIYKINSSLNELELIFTCQTDTVFNSVSLDENGLLWIGSNYGLSYYNPVTKQYTLVPNTLINEISSFICDRQGRVWIGTEEKLFAYLIKEKKFILFGEPDGVVQNEYLEKPRLLSSSGDIYMGGVNGLLHINRHLPDEPALLPTLQLADILVGGERVYDRISNDHQLSVNEKSKPIIIKIITRNKDIFRKPMYRYTITGLNGQNIYSYLPEINLSSLPTGSYHIKAACSTRNGDWTADYDILTLIVLPPWYKSGWFILSCTLFIFVSVILIFILLLRNKETKLKWAMKEHEQQVYEEKVRFLINISHELRTPLTLIHAPLKQLMDKLTADNENYPLIQSICKQSERMKNILNTVLNVRKMEVGQSTLHVQSIQLDEWAEQLISDFKPEASVRGITLVYQPEPEIQTLCFDKEKCTTILTNLLINALKYTPDESTISISTRLSEDKRVRISISDQGPGLKDVDTNNLFVRFYQGNNSRPGTGIGLSYSKILVEQHGGNIGAYDNKNFGSPGATFWFELPLNTEPGNITLHPQEYLNTLLAPTQETESIPKQQEENKTAPNHTLLVVDDNKDLTDYLATALKDRFKTIWVAADGEEALRLCRKKRPHIVVSDIQMPRMNGYELCKQIKEDLEISHIPVILLTARNDEESQLYGYKNGADAYVTKPFEVSMLYAIICSQLHNRERMRTRYTDIGPLPPPEEGTFSSADEEFLNRLNQIITEHLDNEQLGIPFICDKIGISRASLYNKLKALTDMGANDYITQIRMERAIWLILHTELSVNDIADKTGFSTARYFSTVFKQHTGCSPTQYREKPPVSTQ
ncbi:two-component regulator propeller domain-containing protein [Phocaeicola sp.]|uniref:two-component regulator propeller domain-containing protein n=1 Tax=Phocaeicola sp. TaxID=2773926 RepID=UPI003AB02587